MANPKSWQKMRDWMVDLLERKTGAGLDESNVRVADSGIDNEPELRTWLKERGRGRQSQMLLVMERLGYPEFLTASAEDLVEGQYSDRPELRAIYERLIALGTGLGADVQTRKTYVTLTTERRKFALIKPTTKKRVDPLSTPGDVDDQVGELLARAYQDNR